MSPSRLQAKYTFTVFTYKNFHDLAMAYCSILISCQSVSAPADSSWWTSGSSVPDPSWIFFFFWTSKWPMLFVYVPEIPCWHFLLFLHLKRKQMYLLWESLSWSITTRSLVGQCSSVSDRTRGIGCLFHAVFTPHHTLMQTLSLKRPSCGQGGFLGLSATNCQVS